MCYIEHCTVHSFTGLFVKLFEHASMSTLKSKLTRAKNALAKEEGEANESLKQDWTDGNEQQIRIFV